MNLKIIDKIIQQALDEDLHDGDITTNILIPSFLKSEAVITVKEPAIICGLPFARRVFQKLDRNIQLQFLVREGSSVKKGTTIILLRGKTRALLTGERVALNFLSYLSSIATKTHQFVEKVRPFNVKILDTRKTTPMMRIFERYAVGMGGGVNHRPNLNAMVMIKDNHHAACGHSESLEEMVKRIQKKTNKAVEVEVENIKQFKEAVAASVDIILLDNMSPAKIAEAVRWNRQQKITPKPLLEASGGIHLDNVVAYAKTGVDRISIGELTHSRKAIDISLDLIKNIK